MRIAAYHNLCIGGALRVMREQIVRLGEQVTDVYTLNGEEMSQLALAIGQHSQPLTLHSPLRSPLGRLNGLVNILNMKRVEKASRILARGIDNQHRDAVLVHPCRTTQTPSVMRYLVSPTVYYCHEYFRAMHEVPLGGGLSGPCLDPFRSLYKRAAIARENAAMCAATALVCNSYHTHDVLLSAYGVEAEVNYPGVDTDKFLPIEVPKRDFVLSVGRLAPIKGHEFVVESLSKIPQAERPRLVVIGNGSDHAESVRLQSLAADRNVELSVLNGLDDSTMVSHYNEALATLVAAVLEPLGLVALESMACGTPVVAVAEAGLRETVEDGVTGYLCPRDPDAFAERILRLTACPSHAREMGAAGRERVVQNWNWQKSMNQLEAVIRRALRDGR